MKKAFSLSFSSIHLLLKLTNTIIITHLEFATTAFPARLDGGIDQSLDGQTVEKVKDGFDQLRMGFPNSLLRTAAT